MIDTAVTRTTYYQVIDTPQLTSTTSPSAKERPAAQATQAAAEGARGAAEAGEEEEARAEALQRTQRSREAEERSDESAVAPAPTFRRVRLLQDALGLPPADEVSRLDPS